MPEGQFLLLTDTHDGTVARVSVEIKAHKDVLQILQSL